MLAYIFEKLLFISRTLVILPVLFGIVSALILFVYSTVDMVVMSTEIVHAMLKLKISQRMHLDLVTDIIGAVDLYLIGVVLLIFSFGLYELFIPEFRGGKKIQLPEILAISSLDELKDKLAKVIVMVLVVSFFQRALYIGYNGALEMLYFAISISALSVGVYLMHKDTKHRHYKHRKPKGEHHAHRAQ